MLGYWNNPEATAETIRDGWFYSGDLGYMDEGGQFHIAGRTKDMVRRAGENISAAEVEGVLVAHDKVTLAAVIPVPDPVRGEEAKAYIVLKDGETRDTVPPQSILDFAKSRLAAFKVPRYLEYVASLPLTPSERVEKHKLVKSRIDQRTGSYDATVREWLR
jgi:crotonobetaine/carnitine-CoA ligase